MFEDREFLIIWWIIFLFFGGLLIFALIYYSISYKKANRKALTIYKIPIFALFYGVFLVQAYLTRFVPNLDDIIPISFDDATIVVVGLLFGPIEAIIYGAVADMSRTLLNGWVPLPLPFLILPTVGLISGFFGEFYRKNKNDNITPKFLNQFLTFQLILIAFLFVCFSSTYLLSGFEEGEAFLNQSLSIMLILSPIFIFLLEFLFFYVAFKKKEYLNLLILLTTIYIIVRITTGFIIRPYSQFIAFGFPFKLELYERLFTSTYLVPSKIFVTFFLVISIEYALNIKKIDNDFMN